FALLAHLLGLVDRRLELPLQVSRRLLAGSRVIVAWLADGLRAAVGAARDRLALDHLAGVHERARGLEAPLGVDPAPGVPRILLDPDAHGVGLLKPRRPALVPRLRRDAHVFARPHKSVRLRRLGRRGPRHARVPRHVVLLADGHGHALAADDERPLADHRVALTPPVPERAEAPGAGA